MNINEDEAEAILEMAVISFFEDCLDTQDIVLVEKIFISFSNLEDSPKFRILQ